MNNFITTKFTDLSTASRLEKAKRVIKHLIDNKDMTYFYDNGFPKEKKLQNDLRAILDLLDELCYE